jgi:hypothetical protein
MGSVVILAAGFFFELFPPLCQLLPGAQFIALFDGLFQAAMRSYSQLHSAVG